MRSDPQIYTLAAATPVAIRGGQYMLVATGATGNLQVLAGDNSTYVNVASTDTPGTPVSLAGAGAISPLWLPAGKVQLASGSGWLVGV